CTAAGTRKKTRLASVALADHGWAPTHAECFVECMQAPMQLVTPAHPNEDFDFYLCTDASHEFHGAVLTQTQLRWSVEAYAIIYAVKRLDYLLHRARGFTILTDHRNLAFIFGVEPSPAQPRYLADKLARWAMALTCFCYDIRHVPGDENAWASDDVTISNNASPLDLNSSRALQVRRLVTVPPATPSPLGADFEWPTLESLTIVQRKAKTEFTKIKASLVFDNPDGVGRINGCIWIPASALDTQLTLLVIAHAGAMGHRGQAATRAALTGTFSWRNVTEDVALFVRQWLPCVGNGTVPRPLGETRHAKLGAGKAPITAMTMLPPGHSLSAYRVADEVQEVPEASLARLREDDFIKLAAARDQLHREAAKTSATLRDNERARRNKKPNVKQFLTSEIMF
ncbi:hypothetical protein DYB28_007680, partial [Aphanomyces astaci]